LKISIFLIISLILITACSSGEGEHRSSNTDINKPMSWGHKQSIYIFADDDVWKYAEAPLRESLERVTFTTDNEQYFEIERVKISQLEQFYKFNNLIFFCDISSEDEVAQYVKSIMGEKVTSEVRENSVGIYPQSNLWVNDQFVLFLLGDNEENLLKLNILQTDKIFTLFKEKLYRRIKEKLYKFETYSAATFSGYPWRIEIPKYYLVYKEERSNNFISFLARSRDKADRYVAVYYEKLDKVLFTREWLKEKRASLVWDYYEEDEFKDRDVRIENYEIAGHSGWKLSGRWQNMKHLIGGAFQSFAFYDDESGNAYIIDNSVYYPEGVKLNSLMELEIIGGTLIIE
jgi:uncharacterized protein DUF4837